MAGGRNKLVAPKIEKCSKPGYLNDGGNLYLQIVKRAPAKPGEGPRKKVEGVTKSWVFRYRHRVTKKLIELGLGSFPDISLQKARDKAASLREILHDRKDPKVERAVKRVEERAKEAKTITFDEAATKCIADRFSGWKSEKHAQQWTNTLKTYASPAIGTLNVDVIDIALVRKVLDPIWNTKNETASRVRQRLEAVLAWAKVSGYRSGENPAEWRGNLDQLLPKPSKVQKKKHHRAMAHSKIPKFMTDLRSREGIAALALEFTILTAARTGETIGAVWGEFNLEKKTWTVPAERMKAEKEHVVPLSASALKIIKDLEQVKEGPYVFPGPKAGTHLSTGGMDAVLKRMERDDATVHGFRSTFRDWAADKTNFSKEVIEHALAHQLEDKAEAAYHHSTMLGKRRPLMAAWANYLA
ncbi:tyrosine-type recombinase/integrase [Geothrix fuzhouensis]|uniref:tyrosine-type recombinase/integrase n=1 Tax=Geothrix fuzhouensis TaxID=2966451 RepID=UPI0021497D41|nr:site-specific integrase [Geothrix fuzhouensis]